jgi:hypothetical protein
VSCLLVAWLTFVVLLAAHALGPLPKEPALPRATSEGADQWR